MLTNTSLHTLNLEYNGIKLVEAGVIYYMPRTLQKISARGNGLLTIEDGEFIFEVNYLENLKELDISDQSVNSIMSRPRERKHVFLKDESVKY